MAAVEIDREAMRARMTRADEQRKHVQVQLDESLQEVSRLLSDLHSARAAKTFSVDRIASQLGTSHIQQDLTTEQKVLLANALLETCSVQEKHQILCRTFTSLGDEGSQGLQSSLFERFVFDTKSSIDFKKSVSVARCT